MLTQQIWSVLLFLAVLAALPFLIKRWKLTQNARFGGDGEPPARIVSVLAVGPQQRVVTVELGRAGARQRMVLGVTPQNISCLMTESVGDAPTAKTDTIAPAAAADGGGARFFGASPRA